MPEDPKYSKTQNDMLHLANVINQRSELKNNLDVDIKKTIQSQAAQQSSRQNMDISRMSVKQGKGMGYSLFE